MAPLGDVYSPSGWIIPGQKGELSFSLSFYLLHPCSRRCVNVVYGIKLEKLKIITSLLLCRTRSILTVEVSKSKNFDNLLLKIIIIGDNYKGDIIIIVLFEDFVRNFVIIRFSTFFKCEDAQNIKNNEIIDL